MTTYNVSTAAQLTTALSAAKAGDVIVLANGEYGSVTIDKNYSDFVTIQSATPLGAKFDSITINNSSYLKIDGVHVDCPTNTGSALVAINDSSHVIVTDCEVNGKVDTVYPIVGPQFGIRAESSSYITIDNNDVHNVANGIAVFSSDHLTVTANTVDYVGADGFKFGNIDTALIENNTGPRYVYPEADAHEDFMQFQGDASRNVTVRGNVFLPQNVTDVQGIFFSGAGGHSNILIEDNIIYTGMHNGIYVADSSTGITVRDNTVIAPDGETTAIVVPDSATTNGNLVMGRLGQLEDGDLSIQNSNPSGSYYYKNYFPDLDTSNGVTLAELKPKAGSLAETYGAHDRLAELLDGSSEGDSGSGGETTPPPEPEAADLVYALDGDREFNGKTSSVVKVGHKNAFETDEGTIAFSFDADQVKDKMGLVSKDAQGQIEGGNHMTIFIVNGELRAWFEDGDSSVRLSVGGIKANTEYDVMATFDDDQVRLYLNGKLVDSEQFVMNWEDNEQTLLIGASGRESTALTTKITNVFDGTISDLQIWNEAMTPAELALIA
jgi:parallel beta-helix repeat protein